MKVADIVKYLDSIAPPALQEPYDNARLICGDPGMKVSEVLVSLDCTEEVVQDAIDKGCNMIVSHHPIVFGGLKSFTGKNYVERTVMKAIKHDIALFAIHTNLDNVHTGVNKQICDVLGLVDEKILAPKKGLLKKLVVFVPMENVEDVRQAMFDAGAGVIGDYDECSYNLMGEGTFKPGEGTNPHVGEKGSRHVEKEVRVEVVVPSYKLTGVLESMKAAHPYEEVAFDVYSIENVHPLIGSGMIARLKAPLDEKEFLLFVKKELKCGVIRHTPLLGKKIERVALCGGAGSFLLDDAIRSGADVFITGDFKYHQFFDAENKLVIADVGHYESEQYTMELLQSHLSKKFPNFGVRLTDINTNPINYL